ncbi:MAG: SGNH/GDSL hydrolase family protein [Kiritimatiellaeota bacterium]|nr:SGNH/GDSL hydrolase family protein [Kiritimatiellota bacterium]
MRYINQNWLFAGKLFLLDILFLVVLLALPVIWLGTPLSLHLGSKSFKLIWHMWYCLFPLLVLLVRYLVKDQGVHRRLTCCALWEKPWFRHVVFSLLLMFLFFGGLEVVLTFIGFEVKFPKVVFEGQTLDGDVHISSVKDDSRLLWKFEPGSMFNGRKINQMGFREREINPKKQPETMRVICLGDSVTAQGRPCYSEYLHRLLAGNPPTSNRWEAFNMAVYGYSSLQGLRMFEMNKESLQPDIVTLYFGWNDHWLNRDDDRQLMAMEMKPLAGRIVNALRNKRFFQLIVWALNPMEHFARVEKNSGFYFVHRMIPPDAETGKHWELRVPPEDYRVILTAFIREIRSVNAIPVLITAPRRHLSEALVKRNHARSVKEAEQLHDQYLEITRTVAGDCHAELLDLAKIMAGPDCDAFFRPDGIHFDYCEQEGALLKDPDQQPGLMRVAQELDNKIRYITTTPAWLAKRQLDHDAVPNKSLSARCP